MKCMQSGMKVYQNKNTRFKCMNNIIIRRVIKTKKTREVKTKISKRNGITKKKNTQQTKSKLLQNENKVKLCFFFNRLGAL
jgi:hypothetical protein